ncbi:hypothetical protein FH832_002802 [Listeria monocytogenes]|nr:hypothetical protein [Listeria monocytogenes]
MSEKITIPKEIHSDIEQARAGGHSNYHIFINTYESDANSGYFTLIRYYFEDTYGEEKGYEVLMNVLVNGYEVKQDPHEKIKANYNQLLGRLRAPSVTTREDQEIRARIDEMTLTLEILGINIEGVDRV